MDPTQEIRFLKRQLKKEQQKTKRLQALLKRQESDAPRRHESVPDRFLQRGSAAHLFEQQTYPSYLLALLRGHSLYRLWERYVGYFRKIRLVSITLRILSYILVVIQTGTVFFIVTLLLLGILPLLAISALSTYFISLLLVSKDSKKLGSALSGKKLYVLFPTRAEILSGRNGWWQRIPSDDSEDNAVLIVSPYFFSGKGGVGDNRFYFNFKQEQEDLFLIRKYYFFTFRRLFLEKRNGRVTLIY